MNMKITILDTIYTLNGIYSDEKIGYNLVKEGTKLTIKSFNKTGYLNGEYKEQNMDLQKKLDSLFRPRYDDNIDEETRIKYMNMTIRQQWNLGLSIAVLENICV